MAEIVAAQAKAKCGSVKEISAVDYVDEVNKAGEGVWVILHISETEDACIRAYTNVFLTNGCVGVSILWFFTLRFTQNLNKFLTKNR